MLVYYHYHHHLTHSSSLLKLHLSWDSILIPSFPFPSFNQRRRTSTPPISLLRFIHPPPFPFISCYTFLKDPFKSLRLYWRRIFLHTFSLLIHIQHHLVCLLGNQNRGRELKKREKKQLEYFIYLFIGGLFNLSWNTFFFVFLWYYICLEWKWTCGGWVFFEGWLVEVQSERQST